MPTEKRLIDAYDVKELINGLSELPWEEKVDYLVDSLPTVDAVEVVHGRWEWKPIQNKHWILTCSVCSGTKNASEDCNYCPNCGAKMDGDGNG